MNTGFDEKAIIEELSVPPHQVAKANVLLTTSKELVAFFITFSKDVSESFYAPSLTKIKPSLKYDLS